MLFHKTALPNGLRLITVPNAQSSAATVLVLVEAGSKYETKDVNGLSHFLEHMCFKGTSKRPSAMAISSELDGLGAQYNAFTSQEYTGYYAKVQPKHFDNALDIVSDMYLNPLFKQEDIEKEKGVIVEEINMYEDLPQSKVQELIMKALYGDQPAGWSIAGEKDIVRGFSREDFLAYRDKHYVASATVVVVAGNFDGSSVIPKIEKYFSNIPVSRKFSKESVDDLQDMPRSVIHYKESDQTHLVLAVRSCDVFDKDHYAFEVLGGILGGGMSSRLFQRVREEMGAAYYVHASNESFTDHGVFQAAAGVEHSKAKTVVQEIVREMKKLHDEDVLSDELQRVKESITGSLFLGLETSNQTASFVGGQEILKKDIITPEEYANKIQSVMAEDVRRIASKAFVSSHLNFALIGPYKDEKMFENVLKI